MSLLSLSMNNPRLAKIIEQMAKVDQDIRNNASDGFGEKNYLVYAVDAGHAGRIRQIITDYGYPTQDLIGPEAMRAFWLLVQHQDFDLILQEACLTNCDFEPKEKAYLTDRIRVNNEQPQLYGTQFTRKDGKLVPRPIEDEARVDDRRREVGLDSLENYSKKMNG